MGPPDRAEPASTPPVATSEELRRAALDRSARRGAEVARRRLRWRWVAWAVYKLLIWTLPLLLLAELYWALWLRDHPMPAALQTLFHQPHQPDPTLSPHASPPSRPASAGGTQPQGDS